MQLPSFEKWEGDYKDDSHTIRIEPGIEAGHYLLIHSNILPNPELVAVVKTLAPGEFLTHDNYGPIALHFTENEVHGLHKIRVKSTRQYSGPILTIRYPWDIFQLNDQAIRQDFELLRAGRTSAPIPASNQVVGEGDIFLEEGASIECSVINTSNGPVYLGSNTLVMEGSLIRGPFALCEGAVVKMGTRIYGATTIGPHCIAGGEIKNSVMMGYSNKAHDGYLGDAVIGEWCNLGAGTSASNIKNNAGKVTVYNPSSEGNKAEVGIKCGLLMGDYSRCAINTSFNTGSVVGVCSSVFGDGLLPKYIPNFSWGAEGIRKYDLERAQRDIRNWKALKQMDMTQKEEQILKFIFDNY